MSTEQSESAPAVTAHTAPAADITQQATTPTATTTTQRVKNSQACGCWKERGWHGNNRRKRPRLITGKIRRKPPQLLLNQPGLQKAKAQRAAEKKNRSLSTTQWLTLGSIVVSLVGIYYKCGELKAVFAKKPPEPAPEPARVDTEPARAAQPKGFKKMI